MIVLLDTNVLGVLCNPNKKQNMIECQTWFERLLARGVYFAMPKNGRILAINNSITL